MTKKLKKPYHGVAEPGQTYNAIANMMRLKWIAEYDRDHPDTKGTKTVVFGLGYSGFQGSVGSGLMVGFYNGKLSACQNHKLVGFLWSYYSIIDDDEAEPEFKDIDFYYDKTLPQGHPDKCLDFLFSHVPVTFCMTLDMMRLLSKLCGTGWDDQNVLERMTSVEYYLAIGQKIQEDHWLGVLPQSTDEATTNGCGRKILELPAPAPPMVPWLSKAQSLDDAGTTSVLGRRVVSPDFATFILSFGLIIAVLYVALPTGIFRSLWRWFICLIKYLKTLATLSTRKRKIHARPRKPKTKK
eukprot:GHVQ01034395.1.p1 GENE.GHVQ01034395.1~~GHVQ01034395.1.p1  ORF type:complete len:297 (-),score=11.36 GHVQ01034395.1:127-1017(-)